MRNCIRIPRIILPRKDFRHWAVIACDQFTSDRAYWDRVAQEVRNRPSTLQFILPEIDLGEDDEARIKEAGEWMRAALVEEWTEKLERGFILTERTVSSGIRRGLVVAIDLEAYSCRPGEVTPIRSSEEVVPDRLPVRIALRREATLEFPHAIMFYRDKKDRVMRDLLREDLEKLYDFDLMLGGGNLKGYFVPEFIAADIVQDLYSRGDPCFAIADGNHSIAAAKAFWEEKKQELTERERRLHPARFALIEAVNLYDPAVVFHPIHRLVKETDAEAFCSFFSSQVRCRREGHMLIPDLPAGVEGVTATDEIVERYVRANGGKIDYIHGHEELYRLAAQEDCAGVLLKALEKEKFFAQLKGGRNFPKKTFSIGEATEKRYYLEGREISYD